MGHREADSTVLYNTETGNTIRNEGPAALRRLPPARLKLALQAPKDRKFPR
jgi:hypothetical protein